jgi:hypothetical protein
MATPTVVAPTTKPPRIRWIAGADRVAHASSPGHPRTLCGELVVDERFAWPSTRKCMACSALLDELESPLLQRAANGDR